ERTSARTRLDSLRNCPRFATLSPDVQRLIRHDTIARRDLTCRTSRRSDRSILVATRGDDPGKDRGFTFVEPQAEFPLRPAFTPKRHNDQVATAFPIGCIVVAAVLHLRCLYVVIGPFADGTQKVTLSVTPTCIVLADEKQDIEYLSPAVHFTRSPLVRLQSSLGVVPGEPLSRATTPLHRPSPA